DGYRRAAIGVTALSAAFGILATPVFWEPGFNYTAAIMRMFTAAEAFPYASNVRNMTLIGMPADFAAVAAATNGGALLITAASVTFIVATLFTRWAWDLVARPLYALERSRILANHRFLISTGIALLTYAATGPVAVIDPLRRLGHLLGLLE
ncbi:MAG TPA: hypothetical protein VGA84_08395, partial [Thermoanaerobaculia bacterium]